MESGSHHLSSNIHIDKPSGLLGEHPAPVPYNYPSEVGLMTAVLSLTN